MSMAQPAPEHAPGTCPLCGAATPSELERCPSCNYALAGVDGRPPAFSRTTLIWTSMGFLAFYLVTLAIVVATR